MSGRLPHFVSTEPFDPSRTQALGTMRSERFMRASQGLSLIHI